MMNRKGRGIKNIHITPVLEQVFKETFEIELKQNELHLIMYLRYWNAQIE